GDTLAIQAAQRSSARYYQRPDQGYAVYRGDRTELAGWIASLRAAKEAGNFIYSASGSAISPGFEVNDAGFQVDADRLAVALGAARRWTRPGRVFRSGSIGANLYLESNFGGARTNGNVALNLNGTLLNYWHLSSYSQTGPSSVQDRLTRGGPRATTPPSGTPPARSRRTRASRCRPISAATTGGATSIPAPTISGAPSPSIPPRRSRSAPARATPAPSTRSSMLRPSTTRPPSPRSGSATSWLRCWSGASI